MLPAPSSSSHCDPYHQAGCRAPQPDGGQTTKRRRTDRACDACRRRKTKCDGPRKATNICSNCIHSRKLCTYLEARKPRGPPKAYVVGLEDRVEELEALLAQIRPGVDFSDELGPPVIRGSWKSSESGSQARETTAKASPSAPGGSQGASSLQQTSGSVSTSLPPLIIPFRQSGVAGARSCLARTTHLLFDSRRKLKKRRSLVASEITSTSPVCSSPTESDYASPDETSQSDSEDLLETSLSGRTRFTLKMNEIPRADDNKITFHGRSSTAGLVEAARRFKFLHLQDTLKMDIVEPDESEGIGYPVHSAAISGKSSRKSEPKDKVEDLDNSRIAMTRRPQFWKTPNWELGAESNESPNPISADFMGQFPPQDLCQALIDLYFVHCNRYFPLLHQPTFQEQWDARLHGKNFWFACTCLMVFAVASRWCTDERVLDKPQITDHLPPPRSGQPGGGEIDRDKESNKNPTTQDQQAKRWWYAGLPFFNTASEIIRANANMVHRASLFEVQSLALMGMFLRGTTGYPAAWLLVSIGLRRALDAGAHRQRVYRESPNHDDELWKRAFWHLVIFDRLGGSTLGRSVGIGEEDFDLDLPLEVDDPYWGDAHGWKQPRDSPCHITAFNHFIKLTQIIAFTSRTIYAINKPKLFSGLIKGDWRNEVVNQLNTALDEWVEATPTHLKWSENMSDPIHCGLSATLFTTYHLARLLIYRSFIPLPPLLPQSLREPGHVTFSAPLPFPALSICITSARACTRILENQLQKRSWDFVHIPNLVNVAYVSAGLLLLAFWDFKGQQKALVKLRGAGVVSCPSNSSCSEPDVDGEDTDGMVCVSKDFPESRMDTEQVLKSLKRKMEELLLDVYVLIAALEWVEPRWEFAAPMLSQLKQSLPERKDMEDDDAQPSETGSRKGYFQGLRQQRQQERLRKQSQREEAECHASLELFNDAATEPFRRSSSPVRQQTITKSIAPYPTIFTDENHPNIHTLQHEDLGDIPAPRIQPGIDYDSSIVEQRNWQGVCFSDRSVAAPMHQRSSCNHNDTLSYARTGLYTRDSFAHHGQHAIPHVSSSICLSPKVIPRCSDSREPYQVLNDYHPDLVPPKYSPSTTSISLDRPIDYDRKHPLGLSPPNEHQHTDEITLHLSEDRRYHDRHSDVRTDMLLSFPSSLEPEVELQYPWPSQSNPESLQASTTSPYSSSDGHWEHELTTTHHQQSEIPGQPEYQTPTFVYYQQLPSEVSAYWSRLPGLPDVQPVYPPNETSVVPGYARPNQSI